MELHAYTKTISDLFSVKKKYVIPRFQREYSWKKEQVLSFWEDLISNIIVENGELRNQEYFIGALVLIGEDKTFEMQIVDGQQRLTTITILLSAIVQKFKEVNEEKIGRTLYDSYIEDKDSDGNPFFKLVNETPKPFFQTNIQNFTKESDHVTSEEEKLLYTAYRELHRQLDEDSLSKSLLNYQKIASSNKHIELLKKIRDEILSYVKVIYITVKEEDEAYTIFETLNARGMNLSAVDLIKNEIFKNDTTTHPDDKIKTKWKLLRTNLSARRERIKVDTFFRHYWLSKYSFTREDKIYSNYKKLQKRDAIDAKSFLNDLLNASTNYNKIVNPEFDDWPMQEEKPIRKSLDAFNLFRVTQLRSLLLALLDLRNEKRISLPELKKYLTNLEKFHFKFTAVCSSRASGLESKYSSTARAIRLETNERNITKHLDSLMDYLRDKTPAHTTFVASIEKLNYYNHKQLLHYIFSKYEEYLRNTDELAINSISLEHIASKKNETKHTHTIGNLLPLDLILNSTVDTKPFKTKCDHYKNSELKVVEEFCRIYSEGDWNDEKIYYRTQELADIFYTEVWDF